MSKLICRDVHTMLTNEEPFVVNRVLDRFCHVILKPKYERDRAPHLPALALTKEHARQLAPRLLQAMGQAAINWSLADVIEVAPGKVGGHLIDHDAAMVILDNLVENHDANYGVGWDELHAEIDTWISCEFEHADARLKTSNFLATASIEPVRHGSNGDYQICDTACFAPDLWGIYYRHFETNRTLLWAPFETEGAAIARLEAIRNEQGDESHENR